MSFLKKPNKVEINLSSFLLFLLIVLLIFILIIYLLIPSFFRKEEVEKIPFNIEQKPDFRVENIQEKGIMYGNKYSSSR